MQIPASNRGATPETIQRQTANNIRTPAHKTGIPILLTEKFIKMIKSIQLLRLRNDEHVQFNNDILKICEENNPEALKIKNQYDKLLAGTQKTEQAYLQTRGSELTKKITAEDETRDKLVTGIEQGAVFYTYHFDDEYAEAAQLLLQEIKKYGSSIARMNYQAETAALNDLIDNAKNNDKLKAAITLLGLNPWFTKLEESNNKFNDLYIERIKENAQKPDLNLKELRKETAEQYKELVKHAEANALLNPSEQYENFIKQINNLIDKYNNIHRKL